ncbi:hypothetical protein ABZP36_023751 [Zizania latifolia]
MERPVGSLCLILLIAVVVTIGGGFDVTNAQTSPSPPPQMAARTFSRSVSTVITVVITFFLLLVFLCVLVNQYCGSADSGTGAGGGLGQSIVRCRRGLDPAAVAAIPIVPYLEVRKHRSGQLECAVCLTAFDDGDDLRLLKQCSHAFHPDCIDPWLEGHVTCPLCRANLEKHPPPSPAAELSSSPVATEPQTLDPAEARLEVVEVNDEDEARREEEALELERLRSVRRAAMMPRSHSTGHSLSTPPARGPEDGGGHERFTVRLPPHVREEVLKSRRLRHATSLVVGLGGSSHEGSSRGAGGSWHGARRWPSFLARTVSWARGGVEASVRRGGVGAETGAKGTTVP